MANQRPGRLMRGVLLVTALTGAAKLGDRWLRALNKRNPPYAVVLGGGHLA